MVWKCQETMVSSNFLESGEQWQWIVSVFFVCLNAFACFQLQNQIKQLQSKYLCLQTGNFFSFFVVVFFILN